jgi:hypothetical protein
MIALQENLQETETKETFHLIGGTLSADDAMEIIDDLYAKSINFYEIKSYSELIRYEVKEKATLEQIAGLKKAREEARKLLQEAKEAGKSLRVSSGISITII